jgi:protein TonB
VQDPDLTFEAVTATEPRRACAKRRSLTFPLSIAAHLVALGGLVLVPILMPDALPEPGTFTVRAFLVAPPAPPPPPPPPPGGHVVAHVESSRAVPRSATFTAPIEIPRQVTPEASDLGIEGGGPGGAEGGVPGGVEGGVPGGVVGGVVGGLPDAPAPPPQEPLRVGGGVKEPKKLKNVDPVYPPLAARTGVQGVIVLECTVSPAGRVVAVRVLHGIPLLDAAAIEAVKQWVYTPTLYNGVPVPVLLTVNVRFAL